jgi:nucleotide-binding universal stress UspA family protein
LTVKCKEIAFFNKGVVVVNKLRRVLTAVDYSEPARAAFDHALALSRLHDAELMVVHAVPTDRKSDWHARERIAWIGALRHAAQAAGVRFKLSVQRGDPADVILLHASSRRPDLIVLGSSERSGLDRFRFGSVAEIVAREATQPVLVVPSVAGRAADSMTPFENIVVAVDFGEGSREAVERALSMAKGNSRVTVVHVVRGVPLGYSSRRLSHRMEAEYQRHLIQEAWQRIPQTIPVPAKTSSRVHARVVTGDPSVEIRRVASETDADLILVGVTARGPIARLFMGSTAVRVIRAAGRPVLVIPRPVNKAAAPVRGGRLPVAA